MHVELLAVDPASFRVGERKTTREARRDVQRAIQYRTRRGQRVPNRLLTGADLDALSSEEALTNVEIKMYRLGLSARSRVRILRIARSCADLRGSRLTENEDVTEAMAYRRLDGLEEEFTSAVQAPGPNLPADDPSP